MSSRPKKRKDLPLKTLRKIVQDIHRRKGFKIISWIDGACPKEVKKIKQSSLSSSQVLDLAIEAINQAYSRKSRKFLETPPVFAQETKLGFHRAYWG